MREGPRLGAGAAVDTFFGGRLPWSAADALHALIPGETSLPMDASGSKVPGEIG